MEILIILLLIILNGFFALSEIALVSVKKSRLEARAQAGDIRAKTALKLLENPESFLSSIQVGITLIGIVSGVYGGATLTDDITPAIEKITVLKPYAHNVAYGVIIVIITYFSIIIGELIPKTFAMKRPELIALWVAPVIRYFSIAVFPFVKLLSFSVAIFNKIFRVKDSPEETVTEEEIKHLINAASAQGVIEKDESKLHQNVFVFTARKVRTLMTHRSKIEQIDLSLPMEEIEAIIHESAHSKFPVYNEDSNNIIGVLHVKDFFEHAGNGATDLQAILKKPLFIPENMYSIDVLNLFKKNKSYMGIVVDEYGSFEGIVTMHDLIETIVGDLPETGQESDAPDIVKRDEDSYLVSGTMAIQELNHALPEGIIPLQNENYLTLAGFVLYHLGHIPETGEKFHFNGYRFEIVDLDANRIDKVLMTKSEEE